MQESSAETYEREVLGLIQKEGKRRDVIKKLREAIEQESDEDEKEWKGGVLDRIEMDSLDI